MTVTALEFLGGKYLGEGDWHFDLGRELHGAFGGTFGGVLAAVAVLAGQERAQGRTPSGLDCRFLRGLPAGPARVHTELVAEGRTLTCLSVDIVGSDDSLATRATVSYVNAAALELLDSSGSPSRTEPEVTEHADGKPWKEPKGVEIPILTTFDPRGVGRGELGIATSVKVPWDDPTAAAASACLAADMCVGPPVDRALSDGWIPHPNPDLALRFAAPSDEPTMTGHGRLEDITGGLATVRVEVWGGGALAAVGVASSLLLRRTSTESARNQS
jgi:acyl-coenzyme A thioesterase PaaI-like protein